MPDTDFNEVHPPKALYPMLVTDLGIDTSTNELQSPKALYPMLVTDLCIDTSTNELQKMKVPGSMLMTPSMPDTVANEVHPRKEAPPMLVTEMGIDTSANEMHPRKASSPMLVTDSGMMIAVNAEHPLKAPFENSTSASVFTGPMLVRVVGSMMVLRPLQPAKAAISMLVRVVGSVIAVNELHPLKTPSEITLSTEGASNFTVFKVDLSLNNSSDMPVIPKPITTPVKTAVAVGGAGMSVMEMTVFVPTRSNLTSVVVVAPFISRVENVKEA